MSQFREQIISCPSCHQQGSYRYWDSINVGLDPELRKEVLSGSLFDWECPQCGKQFIVPYSTLYHDMKHKFMIFFDPCRPQVGDGFSLPSDMKYFKTFTDYTYRSTFDIYDFKEKIIQLESGLNDRIIEFMKHIACYGTPHKELPDDTEYRFHDVFPREGENKVVMFQCISPKLKDKAMLPVPFAFYKDLEKEPMTNKLFDQKANFPEVSQTFLRKILKRG